MTVDEDPSKSTQAVSAIEIRRSGRHFALYEKGVLLALVCYKVGAVAMRTRIEALEHQIAEVREQRREPVGPSSEVPVAEVPPWSL